MKRIVLLFLFGLILNNVIAQHSVTLKQVTLDSLRPRVDMVHVKGDMNVEDTLYLQDTSIYDVMQRYVSDGTITLGTANQVAFVNSTGTDLGYSDNFKWNDTTLTLLDANNNIILGNIILDDYADPENNTIIGIGGYSFTDGANNILIGSGAGGNITSGLNNVIIGNNSGSGLTDDIGNVIIGTNAGINAEGSNNILIGDSAGLFLIDSNKLYIENSSSANPLIYGDFANDTVRINGVLEVTGDIVGGGEIKRRVYEASAYVPEDSTLTTSATTAWQFLGVGANNKFVNIYAEGFSLDGDTLQWTQDPTDLRDSVEFNISWSTSSSCSNDGILVSYGINIKNDSEPTFTIYNPVTRSTRCATSGQAYSWSCTTMPIFLKDGAKIQIVVKASGSTTVTTEDFGIYLKEE